MTNDKVRIGIARPHPQAVVGVVLSMPEEWRDKGTLISHDGFGIDSSVYPDAWASGIWLRGREPKRDGRPFSVLFDTAADCDGWLAKMRAAVRALNNTLKPKPDPQADGLEVVE